MKKMSLGMQILIGLILGILFGTLFYKSPQFIEYVKPIGDVFIRLFKMIVVPIVISTIVVGVAGVGDAKRLGKLGGKTIIYFEVITTLAIGIGLIAGNLLQPGKGVNMQLLEKSDISTYVETEKIASSHSFIDTFVNIVPTNIIDSIAKGDLLAVVFFSVFFGLGVASVGEKGKPLLQFFNGVADAMFWITNQVMKLAPLGVFALIGVTVSKFGISSVIPLGKLVLTVYGCMLFFVFVVFTIVAKLVGIRLLTLMKVIKDELFLAFSSASSETVLPRLIGKLESFGCPKAITSFVIPTGYTFNLDGSALYQSIACIFIAQMYGIELSISAQISLMLVLMVTSKGIATVPGTSFVVLLATLGAMGIPLEGLAFIAGIDRILDMARTAVNVIGNSMAAIVISKWEGQFDADKSKAYVNAFFQRKNSEGYESI